MRATSGWLCGVLWWMGCAASVEPTTGAGLSNGALPDGGLGSVDAGLTPPLQLADSGQSLPWLDAAQSNSDGAASPGPRPAGEELCDTGIDENLNGLVDEHCFCTPGTSQACYFGPRESAGELCPAGQQVCVDGEFAVWGPCVSTGAAFPENLCECFPETCGNGQDDNCNDLVDEGCAVEVPVNVAGDCVTASCPAWAPFPVGCDLTMEGGDSRGCVANAPGSSEVYFQEGDQCPVLGGIFGGDTGNVSGSLSCSSQQGAPLDAENCALNKSERFYPSSASGCP